MAVNEELARFVRDGLASGATRGSIGEVLRGAGWAAGDGRGALASYAEVEFSIPMPRPQLYLSARDALMYLLLFATLYISAFSLGQLCFQLINQVFPDPAAPQFAPALARQATRWSVSQWSWSSGSRSHWACGLRGRPHRNATAASTSGGSRTYVASPTESTCTGPVRGGCRRLLARSQGLAATSSASMTL